MLGFITQNARGIGRKGIGIEGSSPDSSITVLNSSGTEFIVRKAVLDSDGNIFVISNDVLNSSGASFGVI